MVVLSEPKNMKESASWYIQGSCLDFNLFNLCVSDLLENRKSWSQRVNVMGKKKPMLTVSCFSASLGGRQGSCNQFGPMDCEPSSSSSSLLGASCFRLSYCRVEGAAQPTFCFMETRNKYFCVKSLRFRFCLAGQLLLILSV